MNARSSVRTSSGEALRKLVMADRDGVVVLDDHGMMLFVNPAAARMLKPLGAGLVGTAFGHPVEDAAEIEVAETGAVAEISVSGLRWEDRPARLVTLRDRTSRRRPDPGTDRMMALLSGAERLAGVGSWEYDIASGRILVSPGLGQITGHGGDLSVGRLEQHLDLLHQDDRERYMDAAQEILQGRRHRFDLEHRLVRADGEHRVVCSIVESLLGPEGVPIGLRGTVRDVTDTRRAERARRETFGLLDAIAENTAAAVCVKDPQGRFLFSNSRHAELMGRSRDQVVGATVHDLLPAEIADPLRAHDQEVLAAGAAITREQGVELADGTAAAWLSVKFPILDDDGRPFALGIVTVDVTEQRRAAEALWRSKERFRLLAERSQDVIFLCRLRPKPTMEYISPAVERVYGLRPQDLLGDLERSLSYIHPEDRPRLEAHWAALDASPILVRYRAADGSIVWTEERLSPIRDRNGRIVAVEGALRNVTRRVIAEQDGLRLAHQLEQAERLEAVGRLAGGVAHDFNDLLAVILGNAGLLAEDLGPEDPRLADVRRILDAAERGAALTRQLLIFSRREPSTPEILDLNGVLVQIEDMLRRTVGAGIEILRRRSAGPSLITIDRTKIEQVVLNLVINARAAMPTGGRLLLETTDITIPEPPASRAGDSAPSRPGPETTAEAGTEAEGTRVGGVTVPAGEYVRLTVADTGCGMPPEVLRHAFEPFFTTRGPGEGSGLGLATVYGAVHEAGGHIILDSRPGEGTTVQIYLPSASGTGSMNTNRSVTFS